MMTNNYFIKWFWLAAFLLLAFAFLVQGQEIAESEPLPDPMPGQPSGRPRYDRFNQWMGVLKQFFTEGNWFNGGPDNLLEYITRTLKQLLNVLMNRGGGDAAGQMPPVGMEPSGDTMRYATENDRRVKMSLADILKMIPADRINLNDLGLN